MNERQELERKLKKLILERNLLKTQEGNKHLELATKILSLSEYLKTHDDEYIEKDAKFNRDLCPIAGVIEKGQFKPSLSEKGLMDTVCVFRDCPNFPTCWATKSTQVPTLDLRKEEDRKMLKRFWEFE